MPKPLHIVHVSTPLSWRGGEQQVAYLMRGLSEHTAVRQTLICPIGSPMAAHAQEQGYAVRPFTRSFSLDPRVAYQFRRWQQELKADLWHLHDPHAHSLAILGQSLGWLDVPLVLHRRVDYPVKDKASSRYKYRHSAIKRIICVSHEVKRVLLPSLKQRGHVRVIHSGIDVERFEQNESAGLRQQFEIAPDKKLIGHIGALSQQKDFFTFLEVVKQLGGAFPAHFFLVGEGEQRRELAGYAAQLGVEGQVSFTGFRNDIPSVMHELDLLLFTSEKEGLGTTLLDAQAAQLPIVSTDAGGIPEIVTHQQTGWLAPVRGVRELAEGVKQVLGDARWRQRLVAAAHQQVQDFHYQQVADKTLEQYQEVLDEGQ